MHAIFLRLAVAVLSFFNLLSSSEAGKIREVESKELGFKLGRARIVEPASGKPKAVLICLHGIQSNRDWWLPLGRELAAERIAVWSFNRPGSGNPPPPGPAKLTCMGWPEQMNAVNAAARQAYGDVPVFATGVSWGASPALLASRGKTDGMKTFKWSGAILLNPAFATTRDADFKRNFLNQLWPWNWCKPIQIPLSADDYTSSSETRTHYLQSGQLKDTATFGFLLRTNGTKQAALKELQKPGSPALILLGKADTLATPCLFTQKTGLKEQDKDGVRVAVLPGATHAAILEPERRTIARHILLWVNQ